MVELVKVFATMSCFDGACFSEHLGALVPYEGFNAVVDSVLVDNYDGFLFFISRQAIYIVDAYAVFVVTIRL